MHGCDGGPQIDTYELSEGGVRPEDALGRDALSCFSKVHCDYGPEEFLYFFSVGIHSDPSWPPQGSTTHDEGRQMAQGDRI